MVLASAGIVLEFKKQFSAPVPEETPPPDNFELIRVNCEMVELLELTGNPHRRFCWKAENGWLKEAINP